MQTCRHFADPLVASVGDEEVAGAVNRHAIRAGGLSPGGRATRPAPFLTRGDLSIGTRPVIKPGG
jgi:hypothetical protein